MVLGGDRMTSTHGERSFGAEGAPGASGARRSSVKASGTGGGSARKLATIYESAAEVFVRDGYAGATSKALAAAAGVAESTLFRLVRDKESLYVSLFDFAWSEINAAIADAAFVVDIDEPQRSTDPAEVLVADGAAIAALFEDERARALVTFAFDALGRGPERFVPEASPPFERFRRRFASYVELHERQSRLELGPAEQVAESLLARLRGAWMAWYFTPDEIDVRHPTLEALLMQLRSDLGVGPRDPGSGQGDGTRQSSIGRLGRERREAS